MTFKNSSFIRLLSPISSNHVRMDFRAVTRREVAQLAWLSRSTRIIRVQMKDQCLNITYRRQSNDIYLPVNNDFSMNLVWAIPTNLFDDHFFWRLLENSSLIERWLYPHPHAKVFYDWEFREQLYSRPSFHETALSYLGSARSFV